MSSFGKDKDLWRMARQSKEYISNKRGLGGRQMSQASDTLSLKHGFDAPGSVELGDAADGSRVP